jgi:putrescine transport system substrate-binding protein
MNIGYRWLAGVVVLAAVAGCTRQDAAAPAGSVAQPEAAAPAERVVHVYNWADYIDPALVAEFEQSSGIKVVLDVFDSQDMLETKLLTGGSGYDIAVVASDKLGRLVAAGVLQKLDYGRLPSSKNLDAELNVSLARNDPGNVHAIGYHWGTTGIGYDMAKLKELAPDAPADSWGLLYDPRLVARMAPCGVTVVDAPSEVIATALMAQGRDPNDLSPEALAAAEALMMKMRPSVRKIDYLALIEDLANGSQCLVITWPADVQRARDRAKDSGKPRDLRFVIPREGTIRWIDTLAIPADAPHPAEAHAFIEFLLDPKVAARNANYIGGATANAAAMPMIDEALKSDPNIYPTDAMRAKLVSLRTRTDEESRAENRVWTRFRTGE